MKKKVRDITVDGINYTWLAGTGYYKIFRNNKLWVSVDVDDDSVITPKMIADKIRQKLTEDY